MGADIFRQTRSSEEEELFTKIHEHSKPVFNEFSLYNKSSKFKI